MDSAGAELMALSFRIEKHPEFAADADRVRQIGAWISMGRTSDMEMSLIKVIGAMVGTIRRRNIEFREDLPMEAQFLEFLDDLPDPLPGQRGYVDQSTLPPTARRDTFEAEVEMADVRTWTAHDQILRAVARECRVKPSAGIEGDAMIFAEGPDEVALLTGEASRTLTLRSSGSALRVIPPASQG
jgi:hypothetical protein